MGMEIQSTPEKITSTRSSTKKTEMQSITTKIRTTINKCQSWCGSREENWDIVCEWTPCGKCPECSGKRTAKSAATTSDTSIKIATNNAIPTRKQSIPENKNATLKATGTGLTNPLNSDDPFSDESPLVGSETDLVLIGTFIGVVI